MVPVTTRTRSHKLISASLALVFLASVLRPDVILAQEENPEKALVKARHFYEAGKYQDALDELVPLISQGQQHEAHLMVEIYKYLAFCNSAYGKWDLVKKQFKRALEYNPKLELDPIFTSPKIMEVFQEAREEFGKEREATEAARRDKKTAQPGLISISANVVGADVFLNGVKIGQTPMPAPKAAYAGKYRVEVKKPGYSTWEKIIELRPGDSSDFQAELIQMVRAKKPWYKKAWVWAAIAAAAGGATAGAYYLGGFGGGDTGPAGDLTIYY